MPAAAGHCASRRRSRRRIEPCHTLAGDTPRRGCGEAWARLLGRIQAIEQDHPDWAVAAPDAVGLSASANADLDHAVRERNAAAAAAASGRNHAVEARRGTRSGNQPPGGAAHESRERPRPASGSLADGLTDEQRMGGSTTRCSSSMPAGSRS